MPRAKTPVAPVATQVEKTSNTPVAAPPVFVQAPAPVKPHDSSNPTMAEKTIASAKCKGDWEISQTVTVNNNDISSGLTDSAVINLGNAYHEYTKVIPLGKPVKLPLAVIAHLREQHFSKLVELPADTVPNSSFEGRVRTETAPKWTVLAASTAVA